MENKYIKPISEMTEEEFDAHMEKVFDKRPCEVCGKENPSIYDIVEDKHYCMKCNEEKAEWKCEVCGETYYGSKNMVPFSRSCWSCLGIRANKRIKEIKAERGIT
jgi:hypothetical protein